MSYRSAHNEYTVNIPTAEEEKQQINHESMPIPESSNKPSIPPSIANLDVGGITPQALNNNVSETLVPGSRKEGEMEEDSLQSRIQNNVQKSRDLNNSNEEAWKQLRTQHDRTRKELIAEKKKMDLLGSEEYRAQSELKKIDQEIMLLHNVIEKLTTRINILNQVKNSFNNGKTDKEAKYSELQDEITKKHEEWNNVKSSVEKIQKSYSDEEKLFDLFKLLNLHRIPRNQLRYR